MANWNRKNKLKRQPWIVILALLIAGLGSMGCGAAGSSAPTGPANSPQVSVSPSSFTFANVAVGTASASQAGTLTASGAAAATVTSDSLTGPGFALSGITFPLTIPAGQSVGFKVSFSPGAAGPATGSLVFTNNGANISLPATLSGTGAGLGLTPTILDFASALDGTTASQTGTLSAVGANVTVNSATVTGGAFSVNGLPATPFTIVAGQTQQFSVSFAPAIGFPGPAAGNVAFASSANNVTQTLSGTGTANVALTWPASPTPGVTYNVYRCGDPNPATAAANCVLGSPGNFTNIASVGLAVTTYTDAAVSGAQTYYYSVTAVDANLLESALSVVSNASTIP